MVENEDHNARTTHEVGFKSALGMVFIVSLAFLSLAGYMATALWIMNESARGNYLPAAVGLPITIVVILALYYVTFGGYND